MRVKTKTERFEMQFTRELKQKLEAEANKLGLSKAAFMTMVLNKYFIETQSK